MSIKIQTFSDHRTLLRHLIEEKKKSDPRFSMNQFAKKIEISPSLLKMALAGKRDLGAMHIFKISSAFRFNPEETVYFEALIRENQSKTNEERQFYRRRLQQAKKNIKVTSHRVGKQMTMDRWYAPALLLYLIDIEKVAEKGIEQIDRVKIKKVFALTDPELDHMLSSFQVEGVLSFNADGKVQFNLENVGSALRRQRFILQIIQEAQKRAQNQFGLPLSFFSADTLSISSDLIQDFIKDYQRLITSYIAKDLRGTESTRILQIALQLFTVNH